MPVYPISRHVEDFNCDLDQSETKAHQVFAELEAMDYLMVPYGRGNGLASLEERQANKEESNRRWEEEQEECFL